MIRINMGLLKNPFVVLGLVAAVLLLLALSSGSSETSLLSERMVDWKSVNLEDEEVKPLAKSVLNQIKNDQIAEKSARVEDLDLAYKECIPSSGGLRRTVLLLHGAAFQAKTWVDQVPTMQTLCHYGLRVVAVDLPGHGKTKSCSSCEKEGRGTFLNKAINQIIGVNASVSIVSPSFSGSYSLPFLEKYQDRVCGFIPVAPVQTEKHKDFLAKKLKVPTLIVYGELDKSLGPTSSVNLGRAVAATKPFILKRARHPAYLDQPDKWHQLIINFVKIV